MIAPTIADESLAQTLEDPRSVLAEQLIGFANESFAFADGLSARTASKTEFRHKRFPAPPRAYFEDVTPPPLNNSHLKNARIVPDREQILPLLATGGVCIEMGTQTGRFGREILSVLQPSKLHLCDPDFTSFDEAPFARAMDRGIVELHEGESAAFLAAQPDASFDLIHIQAAYTYTDTARALELAARKLKNGGCIICANYTTYSPLEGIKYGVVRAVNEFCHSAGFEIVYLALNPLGYMDAALRRRAAISVDPLQDCALLDAPDTNSFMPDVWEYLIDKYQIASVLDIGAGAGWSTKWFAERGIYTLGVEGWQEALDHSQCRANIVKHDYTAGPFIPSMVLDLAWCAGFVEKFDEEFIPNFMASFGSCRHVCLTHAEPGQTGPHAVNCKPTEYWVRKMAEFGFDHDAEETALLRATDKHKALRGRRTLTFFKRRTEGAV